MHQDPSHRSGRDEPLDLAVHALPDLADAQRQPLPASGHGKLIGIVLASSLPVLLAIVIFFILKPSGQPAFGELIHPARPMPETTVLYSPQGQAVPLASLKQQWLLVATGSGSCDADCAKHLFLQRQLREMLNKDKDRVDRLWLVLDKQPIADQLQQLLQDTHVLRISPDLLQQWLGMNAQAASAQLILVDPQGNAMLRMPADQSNADTHAALRVLQKLLAASASWDSPGR